MSISQLAAAAAPDEEGFSWSDVHNATTAALPKLVNPSNMEIVKQFLSRPLESFTE